MAKNQNSLKNLKPFPKGTSGNPKGRPVTTITAVQRELKKEGYKTVSRIQIRDAYLMAVGLDQPALEKLVKGEKYPMILRIIAKRLLQKDGFEVIEKLLDRAVGRAQQFIDHTTNKKELPAAVVNVHTLSDAELDERIREMEEKLKGE